MWLLVFMAYVPVFRAQAIWDDEAFLANSLLQSVGGVIELWLNPRANTFEEHYWPFTYTVAFLIRRIAGPHPPAFHVINVLLHATNASLVYAISRRLIPRYALLGAMVFAVHPIQTESVAWIIELKNVLSFFFAAASFAVFLRCEEKGTKIRLGLVVGWLLFAAAMLSKSAVLPWPICAALLLWCLPKGLTKTRMAFVGGLVAIAFLLGGLDVWYAAKTKSAVPRFELWARLAISGTSLLHYLRCLVLPAGLSSTYTKWSLSPGPVMLAGAVWLAAVAGAVILYHRAKISPSVRLGFTWLIATIALLAPTLGFIPFSYLRQSFVADRFAYHASAIFLPGVVALFSALLARLRLPTHAQRIVWFVIVGTLTILTFQRSRLYGSVETLAQDTVEKNPRAWTARYYLADSLARRGEWHRAAHEFAWVFWGTLDNFTPNDVVMLEQQLARATASGSSDAGMDFNRGLLAALRGEPKVAKACFEKATAVPRLRGQATLAIAAIELREGETSQALQRIRELYDRVAK